MNPSTASNSFNSSNSSTTSSSTTHSGGSMTDNSSPESNTSSQRRARMVQRASSSMLQRLDPANESPISSVQTQQLKVLINQLDQLQPPLSSKLTGILNLFNSLKDSEGLLRTLLRDYPQQQDVIRLQSKLTSFVHHFGHALQTTNTHQQIPLNSLQHDDLQACFQGLSACLPVGCTPLFSRPAHLQAQQPLPLQTLIDRLLNRALAVGLPDSVQANGELFDLLNTISRALKAEVLRPEETLCSLFRQSLLLMHDWLGGDQCQRLLSDHNLGRCAVQIATAIRQIPLNWQSALHDCGIEEKAQATAQGINTWGQLLQSCVLRLCAEPVLQRLASSTPHGNDTISLLNVCNTVKDALDHRLLAPNDAALLPALNRLVMTIGQLPRTKLLGDHQDCRPLANFSNFLRALGESCLQHDALSAALPGLNSACATLVDCIASEDFASTYPDPQALSNLCSFLKFCDKQRGSSQTTNQTTSTATTSTATTSRTDRATPQLTERSLRYAADTLLACLLERDAADFHHTDTLGGLISGLAYLSSRQLFVPSPELNAFVRALLLQIGKHKPSDWTDKSKTTLLPALLLMHNSGLVDARVLQPALAVLLPGAQRGAFIELKDLRRESQRVGGIEETVEALPPLPPLPVSSTTSSTSTTAAAPATRRIPGDTPIPLTAATSRASFQATPAYNTGPQLLRADNFGRTRDAVWETPKHVAKRPVSGQILVNNEPTVVMLPPAKKKDSPPKAAPPKAEPTAPDNKDRQASTNTRATSTAPGKAKSPQDAKKAAKTDKPTKTVKPAQTVEAALVAGQKDQVEFLLKKKSNWNAKDVFAVLQVVQREVLFYEDAHVGALDRFLALVLPKVDDANRVALGERFKTDRPLAKAVDNLLIKYRVIQANKSNMNDKTAHLIDSQDINTPGTTALHSAIAQGNIKKVRTILGTDTIPKLDIAKQLAILQDQSGFNALMLAVCFGQVEVAQLLLSLPNAQQQAIQQKQMGTNALTYAIGKGQVDIAQLLLKLPNAQEQASQQDKQGFNALMGAVDKGQVDIAQLLLKLPNARDQASQQDNLGFNALMTAICKGQVDIAQLLLELSNREEQVSQQDNLGFNALMTAIDKGQVQIAQLLLKLPNA
ncbi:MAG: ankyrin repeat domain-containing protein, partial [Burkholderiaceae bacterium]